MPIEIFFSYAHEDEGLMNDVRRQLIVYERNGQILKWHDRMIPPGTSWRDQIDDRLNSANVILLFMSPHFIESKYCYEIEGQVALDRHKSGEARVIPAILRPCAWEDTPFGQLQALPRDGKPISRWEDTDEACLDVARGIMSHIDAFARKDIKADNRPREEKLAYCSRCGAIAGARSACVGSYTSHAFTSGTLFDCCVRCGVRPGTRSVCIGSYTSHDFKRFSSGNVFCARCGAGVGKRSVCTGSYASHDFVEM